MGFIYLVTNQVNGKMYVGKTEQLNPEKRWKQHQQNCSKGRYGHLPIYRALKKYGVENFKFEIIDQVEDSVELSELEKHYIEKYRTCIKFKDCNGYNVTLGGEGNSKKNLDEQDVIRIHIENGYISGHTAEYFGVDRSTIQKILEKHNVTWLSCNEISENNFSKQYGGIVQMNFDATEILRIFDTPKQILEENPNYLYKTLRDAYWIGHKTHHAYGYTWYHLFELPEEYKPLLSEFLMNSADDLEIDDTMLDYWSNDEIDYDKKENEQTMMRDYYTHTREVIDTYNQISHKIKTGSEETTEKDDEFMANFCIYLAHALIKDTGFGQTSRDELCKVADIINDVIR